MTGLTPRYPAALAAVAALAALAAVTAWAQVTAIPAAGGSVGGSVTIVPAPAGASLLSVSDNFNRADANPIGGNWTTVTASSPVQILTNQAAGTVGAGAYNTVYWNANAFAANQCSQGTDVSQFHYAWVSVRISISAETYYMFRGAASGTWQLFKRIAGTNTQIGANYATVVSGDVVKLCVSGTTLTPYINGVAQTTQTDASIATGRPGFGIFDTNGFLDNWSGFEIP